MSGVRREKKRDTSIGGVTKKYTEFERLIGMDIDGFKMPKSVKEYYKWCAYFFSYTVVGTAYTKLAQFPVTSLRISANSEKDKKEVENILRSIRLSEVLMDAGIHYHLYGVFYIRPEKKFRKYLVCRRCGEEIRFNDELIYNGSPIYKFDAGNQNFTMKCLSEQCKSKYNESTFDIKEVPIGGQGGIGLTLFHPSTMEIQHNPYTGDEEYIYEVEEPFAAQLRKGDHFLLETTPWSTTKLILQGYRQLRLSKDNLFVSKAPTHKINGMPIPPIVRAFKNLYIRMKYLEANKHIAEDMLIPLRILFPLTTDTEGRPNAPTIDLGDWMGHINRELALWRDDPGRILTMPISLGYKDIWGNGKLLALDNELRANVTDILADIGIAMEFIYGGATWSKQSVAAIIMENVFKGQGAIMQAVLDYITGIINSKRADGNRIDISIKVPDLVDAIGKLSHVAQLSANGEISQGTYFTELGYDAIEEREKNKREMDDRHKISLETVRKRTELDIEAQRSQLQFSKELQDNERVSRAKDMLLQAAAAKGQSNDQANNEVEMMRINLELQDLAHKKENERSLEGEIAYQDVQQVKEQEQMQEQEVAQVEEYKQLLPPEDTAKMTSMHPEEQQAFIYMKMTQSQLDEFSETLPENERAEIKYMNPNEREKYLQKRMFEETPDMDVEDPSMQREIMKREEEKREYRKNVERMAKVFNELHGDELGRYQQRLMVESTELYTAVRSLADYQKIKEYVGKLSSTANINLYDEIISEIETERPSLKDNVLQVLENDQLYREQAAQYAVRLIDTKGTPANKLLIETINERANERFKELIYEAYTYFVTGIGSVSQLQYKPPLLMKAVEKYRNKKIMAEAEIIAETMSHWDEKTREAHLGMLANENPTLHKQVAGMLALTPPPAEPKPNKGV